jgi:hypothetical protein
MRNKYGTQSYVLGLEERTGWDEMEMYAFDQITLGIDAQLSYRKSPTTPVKSYHQVEERDDYRD